MKNNTQLERYKLLKDYIDTHYKENINIAKIEQVCFYSYRNMNRIFLALHQETIGQYIKRVRLVKAAEYLKYSEKTIFDIALEVGFSDVHAFTKAFKARFKVPPASYRKQVNPSFQTALSILPPSGDSTTPLDFSIEYLEGFEMLYIEYRGAYDDHDAIELKWEALWEYAEEHSLINERSVLLAEILDDNEICDAVFCRYHAGLILDKPLQTSPQGLFRLKTHQPQKYAKFLHKGPDETAANTYNNIYAQWLTQGTYELADLPTIEFLLNHHLDPPKDQLITEIYIPIE
ncbi:MAG: AraC family transcriptional regulator [Saprospiraceae bacterium]|nr:AraC family transcriptional regulator [Saprospiraceae bacterium]